MAESSRKIDPYLQLAIEKSASDLYFTTGAPVMIRIEGQTLALGGESKNRLTKEMIEGLAKEIMTSQQDAVFRSEREVDFAIPYKELGRFRVNVFRQRGTVAMVLRNIGKVPSLDDLNMPPALKEMAMIKRGLVLMVGATGCGKSTTLAALIDQRNKNATGHILTIEDPVEFEHKHRRSIVNQREIGQDTRSYAVALRSALREAPDVILIGECRDRETMESSIQLAGTGHLAISTLHANNAYQALQRIISLFPQEAREQLYMDLSLNLHAIISQRLIMGKDGKRTAAVEVLLNTPYIAELILRGKIDEVKQAMHESGAEGMQTFDDSLFDLYQSGRVDLEQALANADSRENLQHRISFGG